MHAHSFPKYAWEYLIFRIEFSKKFSNIAASRDVLFFLSIFHLAEQTEPLSKFEEWSHHRISMLISRKEALIIQSCCIINNFSLSFSSALRLASARVHEAESERRSETLRPSAKYRATKLFVSPFIQCRHMMFGFVDWNTEKITHCTTELTQWWQLR